MADIEILSYFQDKYKVLHDSDLSLNNNFYNLILNIFYIHLFSSRFLNNLYIFCCQF